MKEDRLGKSESEEIDKYEKEFEEYEQIEEKNLLEKMCTFLFIVGICLMILTVILIIFSLTFPDTYLVVALKNLFVLPLVFGVYLILMSFIFKKPKKKKFMLFKKALYVMLAFSLLRYILTNPIEDSIKDIGAVIDNELYITEGIVEDSYVERRSRADVRSGVRGARYYQYFTLKSERDVEEDEFSIYLGREEDIIFIEGKKYEIIALPNSKTILEYKLVD